MIRDKEMHRELIVQTAFALFEEKGYDPVSISEICKTAGVSRTVFYNSFSGKEEIFEEVLRDASKERLAAVDAFMEAPSDYERIFALADQQQSVPLTLGPRLASVLLRLDLENKVDVWGVSHTIESWLVRLTANCQQQGIIRNDASPERLTSVCIDICLQVLVQWCKQDGAFSLRAKTRECMETIFMTAPEYCLSAEELRKL